MLHCSWRACISWIWPELILKWAHNSLGSSSPTTMPSHTATSSSSSTSSPFFSRLKLLAGEDHCYQGTRHLHNQQTNTPEYLVFLHNIFHFNSTRVTQSCTVSDIVKSASIASLRSQPRYLRPRSDRLQWEIGPQPQPQPPYQELVRVDQPPIPGLVRTTRTSSCLHHSSYQILSFRRSRADL